MLLSVEQARRILKDEDSEFEVYVNMFLREEKGVNLFYVVIKNKATGKKYKCSYWQGYKPSIDVYYKAFDRDKPEFTEVFDDMIEVESFLISSNTSEREKSRRSPWHSWILLKKTVDSKVMVLMLSNMHHYCNGR